MTKRPSNRQVISEIDGGRCPHCGEADINSENRMVFSNDRVLLECACKSCEGRWSLCYRIAEIRMVFPGATRVIDMTKVTDFDRKIKKEKR